MSPLQRAADLAIPLQRHAAKVDMEGAFPSTEFEWLGQQGLLRSEVIELPTAELLQILWHIGRGNLAVGRLYEGHINALQVISWFGTAEQRKRLWADADAGQIFAVWNTQADDGVHFECDGPGASLLGAKTFCSGAGHVSRPIVTGQSDAGWQMVCLRVEDANLAIDPSWWQPMGMRASASFKTDFSGTKVCDADLLGKADDYYRQPAFSGGAIRFCAVQLGGAAAIFDETRRFLRDARRTEDAFQQARIGQMAVIIQSGWQWLHSASEVWKALGPTPLDANEEAARSTVAFAAMMRVATEKIAASVMQLAGESIGARGLMRSEPFERMIRDLTTYLKQPHFDEIPTRVGKFALNSELSADQLWQPQ